jgi:hypothetical protein
MQEKWCVRVCVSICVSTHVYFIVARSGDILEAFNHPNNDTGKQFGVLVVDAREAGEGCSFFCVRRLYLGCVPPSWQSYQQRVGRVVRFGGHTRLPAIQQSVQGNDS